MLPLLLFELFGLYGLVPKVHQFIALTQLTDAHMRHQTSINTGSSIVQA